jgi:hypothetical protein
MVPFTLGFFMPPFGFMAGPQLHYPFRDDYTSGDATSPRTATPGPGRDLISQPAGSWSVAGGLISFPNGGGSWQNALHTEASFARTSGRRFRAALSLTRQTDATRLILGPKTTDAASDVYTNLDVLGLFFNYVAGQGNFDVYGSTTGLGTPGPFFNVDPNTEYLYDLVIGATGYKLYVTGGAFTTPTLVFSCPLGTATPLYFGLNNHTQSGSINYVYVVDGVPKPAAAFSSSGGPSNLSYLTRFASNPIADPDAGQITDQTTSESYIPSPALLPSGRIVFSYKGTNQMYLRYTDDNFATIHQANGGATILAGTVGHWDSSEALEGVLFSDGTTVNCVYKGSDGTNRHGLGLATVPVSTLDGSGISSFTLAKHGTGTNQGLILSSDTIEGQLGIGTTTDITPGDVFIGPDGDYWVYFAYGLQSDGNYYLALAKGPSLTTLAAVQTVLMPANSNVNLLQTACIFRWPGQATYNGLFTLGLTGDNPREIWWLTSTDCLNWSLQSQVLTRLDPGAGAQEALRCYSGHMLKTPSAPYLDAQAVGGNYLYLYSSAKTAGGVRYYSNLATISTANAASLPVAPKGDGQGDADAPGGAITPPAAPLGVWSFGDCGGDSDTTTPHLRPLSFLSSASRHVYPLASGVANPYVIAEGQLVNESVPGQASRSWGVLIRCSDMGTYANAIALRYLSGVGLRAVQISGGSETTLGTVALGTDASRHQLHVRAVGTEIRAWIFDPATNAFSTVLKLTGQTFNQTAGGVCFEVTGSTDLGGARCPRGRLIAVHKAQ